MTTVHWVNIFVLHLIEESKLNKTLISIIGLDKLSLPSLAVINIMWLCSIALLNFSICNTGTQEEEKDASKVLLRKREWCHRWFIQFFFYSPCVTQLLWDKVTLQDEPDRYCEWLFCQHNRSPCSQKWYFYIQ